MVKNGKFQKENSKNGKEKKKDYLLTIKTKKLIKAILMFLVTVIIGLSFWDRAGIAGKGIVTFLKFLLGDSKITIATIILSLFIYAFLK